MAISVNTALAIDSSCFVGRLLSDSPLTISQEVPSCLLVNTSTLFTGFKTKPYSNHEAAQLKQERLL